MATSYHPGGWLNQLLGVPRPTKVGSPPAVRGANCSDLGVLDKGKRVFHINPQIADRIFDLAVAEQDLDSGQVASRPGDAFTFQTFPSSFSNWPKLAILKNGCSPAEEICEAWGKQC